MLKKVNIKKSKEGNAFLYFKNNNPIKSKKAVSEMVAYVILISIALGLALAVYTYLTYVVKIIEPVKDCKDGTTISLDSYECDNNLRTITLRIKNNGRFNVNGVIVKFSDNSSKTPVTMLIPDYKDIFGGIAFAPTKGHYTFSSLNPGSVQNAKFSNMISSTETYNPAEGIIKVVQIQPFITDKKKIACVGSIITEPLNNPVCDIVL